MSTSLDRAWTLAQYAAQDLAKAYTALKTAEKQARAAQAELVRLLEQEQSEQDAATLGA